MFNYLFNYPGGYVPWGACSTTLGSTSNYPVEYVHLPGYLEEHAQLPWGVRPTILWSMFIYRGGWGMYLGAYTQLSWGVCSTTLGSMFNYPGASFFNDFGSIFRACLLLDTRNGSPETSDSSNSRFLIDFGNILKSLWEPFWDTFPLRKDSFL